MTGPATTRGVTARYALIAGLQELAIWLPLPVLVLHMQERGIDLGLIGWAFAARAVLVVLLEIPTGGLADALGRRPTALVSQALTLGSFAALLLLTGPVTLFAYALLQGVGAALHSGALDAWFVDSLQRLDPDIGLQRPLAVVDVSQSAAMLVGAGLGGALPALAAPLDLPWPLAGFGIALAAGLAMRAVVWVLTLVLVHEPPRDHDGDLAGIRALPRILADAGRLARRGVGVPALLISALASGVAMIAVETFWQPAAALTFGSDPATSGVFGGLGALIGVAVLAGSLAVLRWGERVPGGSAALAGVSQLAKGGALLLLGSALGGTGLAVGLALAYFAMSTGGVPHETLLNEAVPSERRSVMLSVNSLAFFLGIALGSSVLGQVAEVAGPRTALVIAGVATVVASVAYLAVASARRAAGLRP